MDIEVVRRATMRRKVLTAQRSADDRLNESPDELREKARDLRIRASAILDPNNRQTMLKSAFNYERQASRLDGGEDDKMTTRNH